MAHQVVIVGWVPVVSVDGEQTEVHADVEGLDIGCGVELRGFCLAHRLQANYRLLTQVTATEDDGLRIWRFD